MSEDTCIFSRCLHIHCTYSSFVINDKVSGRFLRVLVLNHNSSILVLIYYIVASCDTLVYNCDKWGRSIVFKGEEGAPVLGKRKKKVQIFKIASSNC